MHNSFFSSSYSEARGKFLETANRNGARLSSYVLPDHEGRLGEALAMDIASFGDPMAPKILFSICGTHGVEAYAGAAAMLQLIESESLNRLPKDVGVILLHGHNPYGWSHDSRLNEDGIDVNRNFIDHENPPPTDREFFDAYAALTINRNMTWAALHESQREMSILQDQFGDDRFMNAFNGQYEYPELPAFGGSKPCWSNLTFRSIAAEYIGHATEVAYLDWHSGFGEHGKLLELQMFPSGSPEWDATCRFWGDRVNEFANKWKKSMGEQLTFSPDNMTGLTVSAVVDAVKNGVVGGGVVEFGTFPFEMISVATMLDEWAMFTAPKLGADVRIWKILVRSMLAPRDNNWENSCLQQAGPLYDQTLAGLCSSVN